MIQNGNGNKTAVLYKNDEYTFRELACAVDFYSEKLIKHGVRPGSHVALWGVNSIGWLISFLAIQKVGAVAVLCNYILKAERLEPLLRKTDVQFIVYGRSKEERKNEMAPFQLGEKLGMEASRILCFEKEDFKKAATETPLSDNFEDLSEQESITRPAIIMFTTGTTAEPKAAVLSQYGFITGCLNYPALIPGIKERTTCVAVPMYHLFALMAVFDSIATGQQAIILDSFSADSILEVAERRKITALATVATVHLKLIEDARFCKTLAKSIQVIETGGGTLTEEQFHRIERAYDGARLINGYGQTEAAHIIAMARPDDPVEKRASTVGKVFFDKDIRIVTPSGESAKTGEIGEIVVRNHGDLMLGYYGLPKEEQPFDENGDLHSGDLGFLDAEGYLHLTGRIKDIIIKGGVNISPQEIEKCLTSIPNVREALVIGVPHAIYGEEVKAAVTCMNKEEFDEEKYQEIVRTLLGSLKTPAKILLLDAFPLNENNKIDRHSIKWE